ncbi:MAG TPA: phenylalanine--tRNA ligase subunit beta [Solirubrobacteraceae bacterium]|nr:phenylalanine--tRNA ligase subunit beta [Solirubrobacteraceae bacterium]
MRVPLSWLHEYVRPDLDTAALVERLDMTGTAVENVVHHGVGALEHFVVGKVLTAERHPDADRLKVCAVDVGDGGEPRQIVCGAPNVAAGQTVGVARPGAIMPDGTRLKAAKLRGVVSDGMILAEDEVAIGTDHAGTMVLDDALAAGTPLADVLPISTDVLELEITPNRPDCLGVYGIAREVHAITGAPLAPPPWATDPHPAGDGIEGVAITVQAPDLCPRFTARAFEGVRIGPSPTWLRARLMAAGQRPISNVVDVTNYVMLLTGQPLHAFDLDRIAGGRLNVRRARDGEQVTTLDDQVRTLDAEMVVIEDADGPTSIAGVMGGARSEVHDGTTRVLIELATWIGPNINRTSARLGLRSEASGRYEKGLSPEQAMEAQAVASALMIEVCGATPVGGTIDVASPDPTRPARAVLRLRDERVAGLLGAPIDGGRQAQILEALGFGVAPAPGGLDATVPHWRRNDVTREVDLIEEVARVAGIEELPLTLPPRRRLHAATPSHAQRVRRRAEDALVGAGLHEIAGWSFTEPAVLDRLLVPAGHPLRDVVELANPMSERESILRPTIVASLLDAARHNLTRGASAVGLFESGAVYRAGAGGDGLADEHHALAALLVGTDATALRAKALLEAVLGALRVPWSARQAGDVPFLHPGKAGWIASGDARLGFLGELHPGVLRAWEIDQPAAAFALDLDAVAPLVPGATAYRDLISFPALRRDIAVVVADDVPAARVVEIVREAGGKLLASAAVFDVFRSEALGAGRVSLALHLEFRAADRTLADEDVAPLRERIVARLATELGGELRG